MLMRNGKQNQICLGFVVFTITDKLKNPTHVIVLIRVLLKSSIMSWDINKYVKQLCLRNISLIFHIFIAKK